MSRDRGRARFGPWAVVTGASSGIGAAFARQLAAQGYDIVAVGRREHLLKDLALELESQHGVQTRVAPVDLAEPDFLEGLRLVTDRLDVGLLVSAAGADAMGALLKVDEQELLAMLQLNTTAHLRLAHHFGGRLVARGKGGILLVGSMAGMQGTPLGGNYAGAKAYIHNLGQALNHELRRTGVHVSVTVPGATATPGLLERPDVDLSRMPGKPLSAEAVARTGLKALDRNKPLVITGVPNKVLDVVGRRVMTRRAMRNTLGFFMNRWAPARLRMT